MRFTEPQKKFCSFFVMTKTVNPSTKRVFRNVDKEKRRKIK